MIGRKNVLQVEKFPLNTSRSGGFLLDKRVNLSLRDVSWCIIEGNGLEDKKVQNEVITICKTSV